MKRYFAARPQLSWALYDWANSAFATTVMAGFFPAFFRQYWSIGADATLTTFRLGLANGAAGLLIALLAPLLGAIADRGGRRKQFLVAWSLLGIACTAGLYFVGQGQWALAALLFAGGTLGFNGGVVFCDALLLDVAEPRDYDRVSSYGYALGYLGGGLLFAINVLMVVKPQWFGLANAAAAVQMSFLTVAVWWLVFLLPLALWVPEPAAATGGGGGNAFTAGFRELAATARQIAGFRQLLLFLVAYWIYIDGVNTVVKMAVDYGMALGLDTTALLAALLLTQFVAFPAALLFGRLGERWGARRSVLLGLAVYLGLTVWAYFLSSTAEFYAMAVVLGLVQGGVQSLSRSFFGRLVPAGKSAEFFGFYNMVGKFGTVVGPLLMGGVALATGSSRASILSLAALFLLGGALLWRVRDPLPGGRVDAIEAH
ncbi:MAG TPA: MFS transporter [Steroidobacteraceae bacterium]|nr:MFS transporter [Steroidobacteraceae bacterium]